MWTRDFINAEDRHKSKNQPVKFLKHKQEFNHHGSQFDLNVDDSPPTKEPSVESWHTFNSSGTSHPERWLLPSGSLEFIHWMLKCTN